MKATTQALSGIARLAIAARKPRIGKRSWVRPARRSFAVMGLLLQPPSGVTTPTAQLMCADGQSGGRKPRVGFGDRRFAEVEDARGEHSTGMAFEDPGDGRAEIAGGAHQGPGEQSR